MTYSESTDSVADILCQLIAIPSVNPMGRDLSGDQYFERRLSDWLVDYFHAIGAPQERITVAPGRDNIIARYDADSAPLTLLLDAHQDTVPVDGMTIAPFEPRVSQGRISGRGACDVKGGMAAMLFAFRRLFQERPPGAANVILSCTCDEESGTLGVQDLVRYWHPRPGRAQLIKSRPDGAIVAEPTGLDVIVAHKGVVRWRVRTRGRACHSSDPSQGVNAIYLMAHVVQCLEEYALQLPASVPRHPLCGQATLSVGRIGGGISVNIVPDECWIELDRRLLPGEDAHRAISDLHTFLQGKLDFEFEFEPPWLSSPALPDDGNRWLADGLLRCIRAIDGGHRSRGVPFGSHASPINAAGVPAVICGPGSIAQAHTPDEFIEIDQLEKAAEIYFQYCSNPR